MDISVIIPVGRPESVGEAVASLRAQDFTGAFEILLVGEITEVVRAAALQAGNGGPAIQCVHATSPPLRSPAARRNRGAALARGHVLAFLDDDAAAPADWLSRAWDRFTSDPLLAVLGGPNLPFPEMSRGERLSDAVLTTPLVGAGSAAYGAREHDTRARLATIGEIHLVNCVVRADIFHMMNGFNEGLGYGGEDSEFVYLARRLYGARAVFDPAFAVRHHRRPFGRAYLRQRYTLRRNSGRLMWVHPRMYVHHPVVLVGFLGGLAGLAALAVVPLTLLAVGAGVLGSAYLLLVLWFAATHGRRHGANTIAFVPALIAHHVVNIAGLIVGLASVLWMRGYSDIARGTVWSRVGLGGEPVTERFLGVRAA